MAKYILSINYLTDPEKIIFVHDDEALDKRIATLKQSPVIYRIRVYALTVEHNVTPTWIETPCAP